MSLFNSKAIAKPTVFYELKFNNNVVYFGSKNECESYLFGKLGDITDEEIKDMGYIIEKADSKTKKTHLLFAFSLDLYILCAFRETFNIDEKVSDEVLCNAIVMETLRRHMQQSEFEQKFFDKLNK